MKFRLMAIWKFPYRAATIFRFEIRETRLYYHLIPRFGLFSSRLRSRLPNLDIGALTYELPYLTTENLEWRNLWLQPIIGHISRQTKHRSWRKRDWTDYLLHGRFHGLLLFACNCDGNKVITNVHAHAYSQGRIIRICCVIRASSK